MKNVSFELVYNVFWNIWNVDFWYENSNNFTLEKKIAHNAAEKWDYF